jgi:hypothetical protein
MSYNSVHPHTAPSRSVLIILALFMLQSAQAVEGIAAISDAGRRGQAPGIGIGEDGSVHVAWLDKGPIGKAGDGRRVYLRSSRDHGTSFGPIGELQAPKGTVAYPDAAAMPDGSIVVAWQHGEQILAQRISTP